MMFSSDPTEVIRRMDIAKFRDLKRKVEVQFIDLRKAINDPNHIAEAKRRVLLTIPFWVAGTSTALASTIYSKLFFLAEQRAAAFYLDFGYWTLLLAPLSFLLSWSCVEFVAPYSNGSGIPQLMASVELSSRVSPHPMIDKLLGIRVILAKVASSLIGVLGGGAIGREGPTLQIAGSIFHLTGRFFGKGQITRNHHGMILAGGAAGLAAAFNTPLGGIVYVVEELSRSHLSTFRTGVLHAVIMAGLVSQVTMGPYLYFGYPKVAAFQYGYIGFAIAGALAAGVLAAFFGQALKSLYLYRSKIKTRMDRAVFAIFCGFAFAVLVQFGSSAAIGSGKDLLNHLLFSDHHAGFLELVGRWFGSFLTYGAGGAGGIFAPTLAIGGTGASFLDVISGNHLGPMSVLIGMTAALSALTHSPFTSFVLILEMTDRHSAIVPLMIAALVGQGVSKIISKTSFYEFVCHRILGETQTTNSGEIGIPPQSRTVTGSGT